MMEPNSASSEKMGYEEARKSFSEDNTKTETKYVFDDEKQLTDKGPKFGKRHIEMLFYFFAIFVSYSVRIHLSLSIVAMTDSTANENQNIPTFDWTNRNIILSSFFWGYVIPQTMAGWLMTRYGPKWFLIGTLGICSIVGYLIPYVAVQFGSTGLIICRIIQGFTQGFLVPSVPIFISRWVPVSERGRINTFVYSASSLGTVFAMMITGAIAASVYGWPMVFHFFSSLGVIWCILYAFCGYNLPAECKSITKEEQAFIESSTARVVKEKLQAPWKDMFKSIPFLALLYSYTCFILGFWILLTQIPTYMSKIFMFQIKSNGFLSALPYIMQFLLGLLLSIASDFITNRKIMSLTTTRKTFNAVGMIVPAISLVCLAYCSNAILGIVILITAVGVNSACLLGVFINNIDLAPNFSGVIQGVVNGFSNIFAILAPLVAELLVTDERNPGHWCRIFYLASAVYVSGAIVFCCFGSGETQPWNDNKRVKDNAKV
ncbi:unnamed protein product [Phyllotreta striolata]|uniref:Putative inorganic phosphate cotransporter n=1 Tax=Phyllotreta striolata TaxID=444603 RepID=A0A9N9TU66_PHYSR|nr:unnamed protein product [Phyllotreta striolata]